MYNVYKKIYTIAHYPPLHFLKHPSSNSVDICGAVAFKCEAVGNDNVEILWIKDGLPRLPVSAKITVTRQTTSIISTLTIDRMIYYYQGNYSCVAKNETREMFSFEAQLSVIGKA